MKTFILIFIILLLVDSIYLYLFKDFFLSQVFYIQREKPILKIYSVLLCYIFLSFGLYYFIFLSNRKSKDAFLLGIVIYGVFETTIFAIFNNWKLLSVFIDTLWGGTLLYITTNIVRQIKL